MNFKSFLAILFIASLNVQAETSVLTNFEGSFYVDSSEEVEESSSCRLKDGEQINLTRSVDGELAVFASEMPFINTISNAKEKFKIGKDTFLRKIKVSKDGLTLKQDLSLVKLKFFPVKLSSQTLQISQDLNTVIYKLYERGKLREVCIFERLEFLN